MIKLYNAHSVVNNFRGCDSVSINWFVTKREQPVAPYEEMILNYQELDKDDKLYAEGYVDELLTEAEIEELREYLWRVHFLELQVWREEEFPSEPSFPATGLAVGGPTGSIMLSKDEGYDLSVPILGLYDLRDSPATVYVQPEQLEAGLEFAKLFLQKREQWIQKKGGLMPTKDWEVKSLVEAIYDEAGLYVQKGRTRAEREAGKAEFLEAREGSQSAEDDISF